MAYSEESLVRFFMRAKDIYIKEKLSYEDKLRNFFNKAQIEYKAYKKAKREIDKYLSMAKREIDRYLSPDFNFIKILSEMLSPNENKHENKLLENKLSDLIAILLEPNGIHGQGTKFLELFLKIVFRHMLSKILYPNENKHENKLDENKLSDLIKILLEPNGIHGQGTKFLELFLKIVFHNKGKSFENFEYDLSKAKIEREKTTSENRKIDLFIDLGRFVIGIENKPWAEEQENQLEDYFNWLLKEYGDNFILIYLHGTGEEPKSIRRETVENNKDKLLFTSYQELLKPWLEECYKECESQKVRFFIKDFIDWINEKF